MKRLTETCAVAAALLAFACAGMWSAPPAGAQGAAGTVLFDGKSLDNFNKVGDANWRIEDGAVVADKGVGFLVTKNPYTDFQLRIEFWADEDVNSGIYMRCADPEKITDTTCYEANIYDKRPDPTYGTGAIVHLAKIEQMPKVGGKWNTYEITAKGPELTVVLNGQTTVQGLRDEKLKSGPIALQYGASVVKDKGVIKFRKVEIKPL
jgi:Domain of Unknown Function (DUF1080)